MEENQISHGPWLLPFRITFVCVLSFGIAINYKLYDRVRKEITGDRGKAFQYIMKNYTMIQLFGWPCIWVWFAVWQWLVLRKFDNLFSPCTYVYAYHIGIFAYILQRLYVAFHSLIMAAGRYIFVVHDIKVLNWGIETVSRVLIASSLLIPLSMAFLVFSVLEMKYRGWLAEIRVYESNCSALENNLYILNMKKDSPQDMFHSPLYNFIHKNLPDWVTDFLFEIAIILGTALFTNITEGLIYIKCAVFVFRSESKETILASLSEDAKCKRRRKHTIGIQITVISWFLELIGGCIIITRFLIFQNEDDEDEWTDRILALSDIFVCLIPIPLSYLLNDEAIKLAIQAKGWIRFLRRPNRIE